MNNRKSKLHRMKCVVYMLKQLKPYYFKMAVSTICGILKEMSIICATGICAYMVAQVIYIGEPIKSWWLGLLLCCAFCRAIATYNESYWYHNVAYHTLVDYRVKLYHKFSALCPDILLNRRSGQVATTLMNDVEQLEWFYAHTAGVVVVVLVVCLSMLLFLLHLHWSLALALLGGICLLVSIPFAMKGKADAQGIESRHRLGEANSVTLEGINGMNEILTLNSQERYKEKNKRFMQALTSIQVQYAKRMGIESGLLQVAAGFCAVSINLLGVSLVMQGKLEMEWYSVVGTTVWLAFNPVIAICTQARNFGNVFAASERVMDILKAEPAVKDTGMKVDTEQMASDVSFSHVDFKYRNADDYAVKDVTFTVAEGEIVALVGASGAGKSTCTSLLSRLWDVERGKISIGRTDIRNMKLEDLHKMVSVVLQDVYLFNCSVRENIALGKHDASAAEIEEAAKMASVHEFIVSLPDGYDTVVGERGVQMSGGQRQRIAIARAILQNTPILILDEAVSNLDSKTDVEIQRTIRNLSSQKTIIMVAHRLSTIVSADKIILLEQGKVAAIGTHSELLKTCSEYRELIQSQL